jgi:hypothetical protein
MNVKSGLHLSQILKTRDDKSPVIFVRSGADGTGGDSDEAFQLTSQSSCPWLKADEKFGASKLRPRIEPWLTALFQSEHFSLLIGSGLSHAVHKIATGKPLPGMAVSRFAHFADEINKEAVKSAERAGRKTPNIEDQIRVANELVRGLEILESTKNEDRGTSANVREDLKSIFESFASSILEGEANLARAPSDKREEAFNYLVSFLMSFASRTGTRDRLQIFTTNYDRFIEAGAEVAGLHLIDRFVGSLSPVFRSSRLEMDMHYNPPGIRGEPRYVEGVAKFTKLHGSLDWVDSERNIRRIGLPFGAKAIAPFLSLAPDEPTDATQLIIYPNSSKDRETALYPYVELFRDLAAGICRPNSTIVCFGYSFGDEHINRVIEDMLTIPSTHLVVISHSDPMGRIMQLYEKMGRHAQITMLIGDYLGDFKTLVDNFLPKPAIDKTTFRMAELLKARWGASQPEKQNQPLQQEPDEAIKP